MQLYRKYRARRAPWGVWGLLLMLLAGASACSDNIAADGLEPLEGVTVDITVDPNIEGYNPTSHILEMGSAASMVTVPVTSNTRWSVEVTECEGSWCSVSFPDGTPVLKDGEFIIQVAANPRKQSQEDNPVVTDNDRQCKVTIYAVDRNGERVPDTGREITVFQGTQRILISPSVFSSDFPASEQTQEFTVTANLAWRATVSELGFMSMSLPADAPSYVRLENGQVIFTPEDNTEVAVTFNVTLDRNLTTGNRRGVMTVSNPTNVFIPIRVEMSQSGASDAFGVSPTVTQTFTVSGGEFNLNIFSPDNGWRVSLREPDAASWISFGSDAGQSSPQTQVVPVRVARNSTVSAREATVVVAKSDNPSDFREVRVVQMGVDEQLGVTPLGVTSLKALPADGTTLLFRVISLSGDCTISSDSQWLTPGQNTIAGSTDQEINVTVASNPTSEIRSGTLTFTAGSERVTFVVTQLGGAPAGPENIPSFSTPWLGSEWSASSVIFNSVIHFPYGLPEGAKAGVTVWEGEGIEIGATRYDATLTPVGESATTYDLTGTVTGLRGSTTYSAYAYIAAGDSVYRAPRKIIFRTPGVYPGEGDNNPPIIVER